MDAPQFAVAEKCFESAENGKMKFPEIVAALTMAGFDGYLIDYRRDLATYYLPDGENISFDMEPTEVEVAASFQPDALKAAIRQAQTNAPGYTYRGFCRKAKAAGCAGYLVSLGGGKVLYFGRTGDTHTEHMPPAA